MNEPALFPVDEQGQIAPPENECRICGALCHGDYCETHDPETAPVPY